MIYYCNITPVEYAALAIHARSFSNLYISAVHQYAILRYVPQIDKTDKLVFTFVSEEGLKMFLNHIQGIEQMDIIQIVQEYKTRVLQDLI